MKLCQRHLKSVPCFDCYGHGLQLKYVEILTCSEDLIFEDKDLTIFIPLSNLKDNFGSSNHETSFQFIQEQYADLIKCKDLALKSV